MPPSPEPILTPERLPSPVRALAPSVSDPAWPADWTALGLRPDDDGGGFSLRRPDQSTSALVAPDGLRLVAKVYPGDRGARTHANMVAVWNSAFGARRSPPGLPQPIGYLPGCRTLLMQRLPGRPLAEDPRACPERHDDAIRLLAELHASQVEPEQRRSSRGLVRSAERKAARIAELAPAHAALAHAVAAALAATRVKDPELVPSHGDFSPRNVLAAETGALAVLDWDRLQLADPARDVVYFGTSDWADWLRRGRAPSRERLKRAVAVYEQARPGVRLRRTLRWHVALACLRRAASVLELWPEQAWLAPAWLMTARRELEEHTP